MTKEELLRFTSLAHYTGKLLEDRRLRQERLTLLAHPSGQCSWAEVMAIVLKADGDKYYDANCALLPNLTSLSG